MEICDVVECLKIKFAVFLAFSMVKYLDVSECLCIFAQNGSCIHGLPMQSSSGLFGSNNGAIKNQWSINSLSSI